MEAYAINNIGSPNEHILNSLYKFYGSSVNIQPSKEITRILPILSGNSVISIRAIDWFVTNYCKKNNIVYTLEFNKYFNVYMDYKSQLKGYKKKLFDPFCRKHRIPFYYTYDKCLITTIGQLIFFRWTIQNKILDYIETHIKEINNDMNKTIKKNKNKTDSSSIDIISTTSSDDQYSSIDSTETSTEKKRHELSKNAFKTINCHKMKIILDIN
jgi:hypothetical protein